MQHTPYPTLATAANVPATSGTQFRSLPQDTLPPVLADAMIRPMTEWFDWDDLVALANEETDAILDLQVRQWK